MKFKFIHDRHKIKLENLKKMSLSELMEQSSSKNDDKRRAEFDLPPLWYMEKVYGIELPSGYKISDKN